MNRVGCNYLTKNECDLYYKLEKKDKVPDVISYKPPQMKKYDEGDKGKECNQCCYVGCKKIGKIYQKPDNTAQICLCNEHKRTCDFIAKNYKYIDDENILEVLEDDDEIIHDYITAIVQYTNCFRSHTTKEMCSDSYKIINNILKKYAYSNLDIKKIWDEERERTRYIDTCAKRCGKSEGHEYRRDRLYLIKRRASFMEMKLRQMLEKIEVQFPKLNSQEEEEDEEDEEDEEKNKEEKKNIKRIKIKKILINNFDFME